MPNWKLSRLKVEAGKPSVGAMTEFDGKTIKCLESALRIAAASNCTKPVFSRYHVKGMITTENKKGFPQSGNIEYGNCQALHNEEMAVAALISRCNSSEVSGTRVLTIVSGKGEGSLENLTMPCGNCRDILRDVIGEDCLIVSGTEDGGTAIVAKLSDCLFERYSSVEKSKLVGLIPEIKKLIWKAAEIQDNPYNNLSTGQRFPLRNYYAQVFAGQSKNELSSFLGALDVPADFHAIYPIEDALRAAKRNRALVLKGVKVISFGSGKNPPDVMYRDRQRLLEAAFDTELLIGERCNPEVLLVTVDMFDVSRITGAWRTTVEEWLPFPFSPRCFGAEFLEDRRQKLKDKIRR